MSDVNSHVKAECLMALYEETMTLGDDVKLVREKETGKLFVLKTLVNYNLSIYENLRDNPHENIARIYEIAESEGHLIIIEEYINGINLNNRLTSHGPFSHEDTADIVLQLCDALEFLHSCEPPIIHRDIKPSNVMYNDGKIKLIDFDTSRYYRDDEKRDTSLLGTHGFAAPEQFGFRQTDSRSDIYSLGVLINYLLCAKHPNDGVTGDPLFGKIVLKCTDFAPENRYPDIAKLRKDLESSRFGRDGKSEKRDKTSRKKTKGIPLPGFRTLTPWKMILAGLTYVFLVYFWFEYDSGISNPIADVIDRSCATLMALGLILLYTNFLDVKNRLPLLKSVNTSTRIWGYVLYSMLIAFSMAIIAVLAERIFV